MPEGDSIRRVAAALAPLLGQSLERATTQGLIRDLAGRIVRTITPIGKHLVIDLDDGTQLRMHLGMNGRVRVLAREPGEALVTRLSPGRASLVLVTQRTVAIWIQAPTVEVAPRRGAMRGVAVAALGPDVMADDFDAAAAADRALAHPTRMIGEVMLDQRVCAGIGNIWRCESLFACSIHPRTLTARLARGEIASLYEFAHSRMRDSASVTAGRPARDRFAVYSRTGLPCTRCETHVSVFRLGDPARWTWVCATCQPLLDSAGVSR